jgi:hypothetical protein
MAHVFFFLRLRSRFRKWYLKSLERPENRCTICCGRVLDDSHPESRAESKAGYVMVRGEGRRAREQVWLGNGS